MRAGKGEKVTQSNTQLEIVESCDCSHSENTWHIKEEFFDSS